MRRRLVSRRCPVEAHKTAAPVRALSDEEHERPDARVEHDDGSSDLDVRVGTDPLFLPAHRALEVVNAIEERQLRRRRRILALATVVAHVPILSRLAPRIKGRVGL